MNPTALLALIAELYERNAALAEENKQLRATAESKSEQ